MAARRSPSKCEFDGCENYIHAHGLCGGHEQQMKRGVPLAPLGHYLRKARTCDHCAEPVVAHGRCASHHYRWYRYGDPNAVPIHQRPRERKIDSGGYARIYMPEHPRAYKDGRYLEHRIMMERIIGRLLYDDENVHHINGIRDDNRPENLELWVSSQPSGQRAIDQLIWAREIEARYGHLLTSTDSQTAAQVDNHANVNAAA